MLAVKLHWRLPEWELKLCSLLCRAKRLRKCPVILLSAELAKDIWSRKLTRWAEKWERSQMLLEYSSVCSMPPAVLLPADPAVSLIF